MKPTQIARVCHVITGLGMGGAEMMLWKLLSAMRGGGWDANVVSLLDYQPIGPRIQTLGVAVETLGMALGMRSLALAPFKLRSSIRRARPSIVQGWMSHGNFAALLGRPSRDVPLLWNIRQSLSPLEVEKPVTAMLIRAGARFSHCADHIIYNSRSSAAEHERFGYDARRTVVIPNGFDTDVFKPSVEARDSLRSEFGLQRDAVVIGHVGRYHAIKNHEGFIAAASRLMKTHPNVTYVLAGVGVDQSNDALTSQIAEAGLRAHVRLLGRVDDTPGLMAGLDILCCSSWNEGFANVIGEAMSCAVPIVATDVGDSAWIVGNTGIVVKPNVDQLAAALITLVDMPEADRRALGARGRERVVGNFALPAVAAMYVDLYTRALAERSLSTASS